MPQRHPPHHEHSMPELFSEIDNDPEVFGRELSAHLKAEGPRAKELRDSTAGRLERGGLDTFTFRFAATHTRQDQKDFGPDEAGAFKNAVVRLLADGTYRTIALIHTDMSHNMHTMGVTGTLRFLPWHRRYLAAFEEALIDADRALRPDAAEPVTLPYWRWVDPFPEWLLDFLPVRNHPVTGAQLPGRTLGPASSKPTAADVATILEGFGQQLPGQDVDDYTRFTWGLEGNGLRPNGTRLPAHNSVHSYVGGIMNNTRYSPFDPVFWLHHAEVDRLWHIWQLRHPDAHPALTGSDRVMDPWPESYDDLTSIAAMGYAYASEAP